MKVFSLPLLAAAALALTGCDTTTTKKEAAQTSEAPAPTGADAPAAGTASGSASTPATENTAPMATKTSDVALPAGLKLGRWQGYLMAKNHAVHFGFEVALEENKAIAYLVNEGPAGPQRLRCDTVRPIGDSAIISLPGTAATLVVRANGTDHLAGAWVQPNGKKAVRTAFSAIYGEQSPLRPDAATPDFAGTWKATIKTSSGKSAAATLVIKQDGAKLTSTLTGTNGSFSYLSGAALGDGMGISSFDGRTGVLLQAKKLPDGSLKGLFYADKAVAETWTAVRAR